jgi:beta-glucanase (GH16 family)
MQTVISYFSNVITTPAQNGATAIGMDECGDLVGPKWGHLPGEIPGVHKMALAAKGLRQGKKLYPDLFVAAWNPGSGAEADGIFSGLMKDHTFDLAMFETYTRYPPKPPQHISLWYPRFEYARKEGWLNRSIPCLGFLIGQSKMNPTGWTQAELRATAMELKTRYPEMPGIGFYGRPPGKATEGGKTHFVADLNDTATLELITFASKLSKELFPDHNLSLWNLSTAVATKMDDEAASCVGYVVSGAGAAEVNGCYVSNSRPDGGSSSISFANRANGIVLSKNPSHRGAWQFLNQSSGKVLYLQFTSPTVPSTALPPVSSVPVTVCSSWVWPLGWTCSGKGRPPQPAVTRMGLPPVPPPPLDPPSPPALPPPPPPAMELVMSEDFSGSTLNRSRWQVYTGIHHGGIYESDNVVLRNGSLVLRTVAKNQSVGGKEFYVSSGAVNQSGRLEQRYGRWSARVKLPDVNKSPGWVLHSSVWLVNKFYDAQRPNSSNSSGYSGCHQEIDIVEQYAAGLVPSMDSTAAGALHASTGTAATGTCKSICCGPQTYLRTANFHSDFHIFTLDWSATRISVSIDGVAVLDYTESAVLASYTDRQFLALTSCVMNRVPPMIYAGDSFPLEYEIDWVRVYRWKSNDLAIKMDDEEAGSLSRAHVFWASDATRSILSSCALPCGWLAIDERGNFVAEGKLGSDLTVRLLPSMFGVGFYRIQFSRPEVNGTTAAILRSPESGAGQWPMQATPVAIDTAQAWLVPCDYSTQLMVSSLAAAAGCGWTRDRLRWSDLEPTRGEYAPAGSTCCETCNPPSTISHASEC